MQQAPRHDFFGADIPNDDIKRILTKSGNRVQMVDTPGKETLVVTTPNHTNLTMTENSGATSRTLITLHSDGDIVLHAPEGRVHAKAKYLSREVGAPGPEVALINSARTTESISPVAQRQNMDKVAMGSETAAIGPTRTSVANKNPHEYGGLILQRDKDGKISATAAITGAERQVDVDSIKVPNGYTVVGEYHTHPHATATVGEGPSPGDIY